MKFVKSFFQILDDIHTAIFREGRKAIKGTPAFLLSIVHMIEQLFEYETTKRILAIVTIIFLCYISFTKSDHYFATTDALPNNISTLNIIFNKKYDITNVAKSLEKKDLDGIYVTNKDGVIYPKTSVFLGIAGVPAYTFMHHLWGVEKLDNESFILSQYSQYFGKFYASFLSAVSAAFVYLILRFQKFPHGRSFGLALVYGLCTNVFNIAAQSNIQHAISLFLVTGATAIFFWKPKNRYTLITAGTVSYTHLTSNIIREHIKKERRLTYSIVLRFCLFYSNGLHCNNDLDLSLSLFFFLHSHFLSTCTPLSTIRQLMHCQTPWSLSILFKRVGWIWRTLRHI